VLASMVTLCLQGHLDGPQLANRCSKSSEWNGNCCQQQAQFLLKEGPACAPAHHTLTRLPENVSRRHQQAFI
jgi:hypothetical protein